MNDNDLIRRRDALAAMKRAKAAYLKSTDNTPLDFFWWDAIAALPAVTVGVKSLTSETEALGELVEAVTDATKHINAEGEGTVLIVHMKRLVTALALLKGPTDE